MNAFELALRYLNDPLNWRGSEGIPYRTGEHLAITGLALAAAAILALPLAFWLGHRGRGGGLTVLLSNVSRAMPTLALLTIFSTTFIGFGNPSAVVALTLFAIPPLLANTYVGIRSVDPEVVESARGVGMSGAQVLWRVEVPLALPLIAAGLRTAAVQVVATAPLAAFVGGGTLGIIISQGFANQDAGRVLAGGVLVAVLALLTEGVLALVQRAVTPGRSRRRIRRRTATAADPVPA